MNRQVDSGMLRGRPFGGVGLVTLINNGLRSVTETNFCDEHYSVIRVADYIII